MIKNLIKIVVVVSWMVGIQVKPLAQKPELVVSIGHTSEIESVAYSPDGKMLASSEGRFRTINLWEVSTGRKLRSLIGHSSAVCSVAFSPDGNILASGGEDTTIKLWEIATGRELRTLRGHGDIVKSVTFNLDGNVLASGSWDNTIKLWDVLSGKELRTLRGHMDWVNAVALSPDGKTLASGSRDETIKLWEVASGRIMRTLSGYGRDVRSIAFSPDGNILASGRGGIGKGGTINLWEVSTGKVLRTFAGDIFQINSIDFSPDGNILATGGTENAIKLWDVSTGRVLRTLPGQVSGVNSVAFSLDGKVLASGWNDKTIKLWELPTGKAVHTFGEHASAIIVNAFSPDGKVVASGGYDKTIQLWGVTTGRVLRTLTGHKSEVESIVFSPDGKVLASSEDNRLIKLWEVATGRELYTFPGQVPFSGSIAFSPDGKVLVTSGDDRTIRLWNVTTGGELRTLAGQASAILANAFSPDSKVLVIAGENQIINFWDVATGKKLRAFAGHKARVYSIAFSPDGKVLATAGDDQLVNLWDVATGKKLRTFAGHKAIVYSVAFSPDGNVLASGSFDDTIKQWDIATGKELLTHFGTTKFAGSVAYSPDGKVLVSGSSEGADKLWDAKTGKLIVTRFSFGKNDWAVIDPEGRFDATSPGLQYLHFSTGLTTIALDQLKERYYDPGLLSKLLGDNREPLRDVSAFNEAKLFPEVNLSLAPDNSQLNIKLTNRGGGIGRTQVFINDSELIEDARGVGVRIVNSTRVASDAPTANFTINLLTAPNLKPGEPNRIRVVAWNSEGYLSSPGEEIEWTAPGTANRAAPVFYAIVGGVSQYGEPRMSLRYSAQDARAMAQALQLAASRLLGADRVKISLLVSGAAAVPSPATAGIREVEPTKDNFVQTFNETARQAKPNDILLIFLAGHGISLGLNNSEYCYLTKEARSLDKNVLSDPAILKRNAITSAELKEWVTQIPANKRVLILDTCEAGAASTELALVARTLSGDQVRALDRLKDRTGFYVLMGAAANKSSYETSSYGQGLLTYSLLQGIKGAALRDEKYVDVSKLFAHAQDTVPRLANDSGTYQQPHFMAKEGATFDIGMLLPTDREQIKLAQPKPSLLLLQLIQEGVGYDSLELSKALREKLREATATNEIKAVLLSGDDYPGAISVTGTYQVAGALVRVKMVLVKDKQPVSVREIEGAKTDVAGLVQRLAVALKQEVEKPFLR